MVDVYERPYQLTNEPNPTDTHEIILDRSDLPEPMKTTRAAFLADEVADRQAGDTAIITGAGLNTNGTMPQSPTSNYLKNADFIAAGYNVDEYHALLLLDAAVQTLSATGELSVIMTLTNAELLTLNGTPVTKLAAPVAGTFYHITEVLAKNNFLSVPYACNAAGIIARFIGGGADAIVTLSQAFVQSVAVVRTKFLVEVHDILLATGIEFFAPVSDPTKGDGTIQVIFRYQLLPDFSGIAPPGSSCCVTPITDTFVTGDLTALGNLEIHHAQGTTQIKSLVIMDNTGYVTSYAFKTGDETGADTTNYITVSIGTPITGTWQYMILF